MIESKHRDKKLMRRIKWGEWWFKITKYRKIKKRIADMLYEAKFYEGIETDRVFVVPSDFKYSDETVLRALKLLVKNGELVSMTPAKEQNADGYILVVARQNRSQRRFSRAIPKEIDLNDIEVKPIPQNEEPIPQSTTEVAAEKKPEQTNSPAGTAVDVNNTNGTVQAKPFD